MYDNKNVTKRKSGRPNKNGIDWWPMETDFFYNERIELLDAQYHSNGIRVYLQLVTQILNSGFYLEWTDDKALLLASKTQIHIDEIKLIIDACINRELFNPGHRAHYSILTSVYIQNIYFKATYERKMVEGKKDYLLVDLNEFGCPNMIFYDKDPINQEKYVVNPEKTTLNLAETPINPEKTPQSIVENSKKENSGSSTPSKDEVLMYFSGLGMKKIPAETLTEKFYNYYEKNNWSGVKNWNAAANKAATTWDVPDNEHRIIKDGKLDIKIVAK